MWLSIVQSTHNHPIRGSPDTMDALSLAKRLLDSTGYIPFIKLSAAFLIGLLPYIYLPLSANLLPENKSMSWGHVATFEGFSTTF